MNTLVTANIDNITCPLCGHVNQCAMEIERKTGIKQVEPCWCTAVKFDADLLARVPPEKRNLTCICEVCATLGGKQRQPHDSV